MLDTLKSRVFQGKQYIKDIKNADIKSEFRGFPKISEGSCDPSICPTGALNINPLSIDIFFCNFVSGIEYIYFISNA